MSILFEVIAAAVVLMFSIFVTVGGFGNISLADMTGYIDSPSLIIILLWTFPVLIGAGMLKDFVKAFGRAFSTKKTGTREELMRSMEAVQLAQRANWVAGILGFLAALVYICKSYGEIGTEIFLLNVAVAVIVLIYAALFNLILLAVYGRLKKRYIEYMQGE